MCAMPALCLGWQYAAVLFYFFYFIHTTGWCYKHRHDKDTTFRWRHWSMLVVVNDRNCDFYHFYHGFCCTDLFLKCDSLGVSLFFLALSLKLCINLEIQNYAIFINFRYFNHITSFSFFPFLICHNVVFQFCNGNNHERQIHYSKDPPNLYQISVWC